MDVHGKRMWAPAIVAVVVLISAVVAGAVDRSEGDEAIATTSSVALTVPTSTLPQVVTVPTSQPVQKTTLSRTLGFGSSGDEVRMVQERLIELGFAPGEPDGYFGLRTQQAVWAFEKLVLGVPREEVTGQVTNETWSRMQDPIVIRPRRPNSTPRHTEIYLPEQVLIVFHDDVPVLITHISSGSGEEWCEEVTIAPGEFGNENGTEPLKRGECGRSITPGGVFKYNRMRQGRRETSLGGMYNPVYFNYGIAVHGAHEVPNYPASHGCIRIPMFISEYFQLLVSIGDQVYVWDGVKEPEAYGAQPPVFNWRDPNYTTTTSSSTTTTTVPPTTTMPHSATTKPPATTSSTTTSSAAPGSSDP